ncbi:hypothetical protein HS041_12070 [Planomonospora sp. ID67723]|uniref:helix-turn-helix transcriptional regulator n=1 Tax=Planomonospora sp. ID67723 TaxID=2738134 RepID=UPI0018C36EB0|nr:hypothetical protein [Planomonospora sp. ID67723]MBG0828504.1 hypothetical protein [Planomonospora sp. ID67723]
MSTETTCGCGTVIAARLAKLPALMRVVDLVAETGLSKSAIHRMLDSGEIKSVRPTGGTRAVPAEWFVEWLEGLKAAAVSGGADSSGEAGRG